MDRRRFLTLASAVGATIPAGLLSAEEHSGARMLAGCEGLLGLEFTPEERELMLEGLEDQREDYGKIREVHLDNSVSPALRFDPEPFPEGAPGALERGPFRPSASSSEAAPANLDEAAFWPVTRLAPLVREGKVTSVALTRMYLDRLNRFDPALHAVVTLTEERALAEA